MKPMQPGDVLSTYADVSAMKRDYGWSPTTSLDEGLPAFVEWYRKWRAAHACVPGAGMI
jgi:UDP-glucuronate 4-epimerase